MWHLSSAYMYGQAGVLAYTGVITKVSCIDRFSVPKAIGLRCYSQIFTWDTLNYIQLAPNVLKPPIFSRLLCSNLKSRPILHISKRNYKKTEPDYRLLWKTNSFVKYYLKWRKLLHPSNYWGHGGWRCTKTFINKVNCKYKNNCLQSDVSCL